MIRQWAMQKGNERVQAAAQREASIKVRPHPWISAPVAISVSQFPQILKNRADRAMIESKGG